MAENARLILPDKEIELPIVIGTENEKAIDISSLRAKTGYVTLDDGYMNTGACLSAITYIDGDKGILRYRGYPIEQLAEHASFLEVSYLLLFGELPTSPELEKFTEDLKKRTMLDESIKRIFTAFPRSTHPMAILCGVVSALSAFYRNMPGEEDIPYKDICRMLAKMPTIIAWAYTRAMGRPFNYPKNSLSYCENFFHMMFAVPAEEYQIDEDAVRALDMLLVLHADHEQNCSTSAVRLARSAHANVFAAITSGVCALWGPRHGGANEEVIRMLDEICQEGGDVKKFIAHVKDKDSHKRLMGFGHRVYKNFDPRAKLIKKHADRILSKLHKSDAMLDVAKELEEAALSDSYFIERKLYPNVDFYSGIIYRALGIPSEAFTSMFAMGRLPGWLAQAIEFGKDPKNKIGRPRQIYIGENERAFVPIAER